MATLETFNVANTGNNAVDSLLSGVKWSSQNISYSFPTASSIWVANYSESNEQRNNFQPLTANMQAGVIQAFSEWAAVANLSFAEVADSTTYGVIRLGQSNNPDTAYAYTPTNQENGGDVWFGYQFDYTNPKWQTYSNYAFMTMVHEIGHSLGLKHPGKYGNDDSPPFLDSANDALQYSIMSYRSYPGANLSTFPGNASYPQTPMMLDIAAIQYMYGANFNNNSGNTSYVFSPNDTTIFRTIWDGNGIDTYDASAYVTGVTLDLAPGHWSTLGANQLADLGNGVKAPGSVANALLYQNDSRSLIENAIGGSDDDILLGGPGNNSLQGGGGNDHLWGGSGGNDTLTDTAGDNMFWWTAGEGNDTVTAAGLNDALYFYGFAYSDRNGSIAADGSMVVGKQGGSDQVLLSNWQNQNFRARVQSLVFNDGGVRKAYAWNGGNDVEVNLYSAEYSSVPVNYLECVDTSNAILRGSSGADVIKGGSGNDHLWGGAGGADTLSGGAGADTYWWDTGNGQDIITYSASNVNDTVKLYTTNRSGLSVSLQINDLVLAVADGSTLTIKDWSSSKLNQVIFADGSSGTLSSFLTSG